MSLIDEIRLSMALAPYEVGSNYHVKECAYKHLPLALKALEMFAYMYKNDCDDRANINDLIEDRLQAARQLPK